MIYTHTLLLYVRDAIDTLDKSISHQVTAPYIHTYR